MSIQPTYWFHPISTWRQSGCGPSKPNCWFRLISTWWQSGSDPQDARLRTGRKEIFFPFYYGCVILYSLMLAIISRFIISWMHMRKVAKDSRLYFISNYSEVLCSNLVGNNSCAASDPILLHHMILLHPMAEHIFFLCRIT